jgi:PEP-CTERM/exosortase A-associated glycosyltransferase
MKLEGLKILHVFDHSLPIHSGYSFRSIALLREQRKQGWETCHLTTPRHTANGPICEEVDGFRFYRTPPLGPVVSGVPIAKEMAQIHSVARRIEQVAAVERPKLLHAHSPVLNALSCLLAARKLRLPVVYEVRALWEDAAVSHGTASEGGPRYRACRALETYALKRCDAIVTICEGLRKEILSRGIPKERVTVVPNGVEIDEIAWNGHADPELRRSLQLEGKLVLGFLGSFYEYEGIEDLIVALRRIRNERSDVVLLLAGGGPLQEKLKQQARASGVADAVRFVGRIPHDRVSEYYALVDLFVYPRRPMRLTEIVTPLKPLEAMAGRGIVLASDVGGHRELIVDKVTGYLYPAGDIEALAETVLSVIAHREEWGGIRKHARQYVEQERRWETTTGGYLSAYPHALAAVVRAA